MHHPVSKCFKLCTGHIQPRTWGCFKVKNKASLPHHSDVLLSQHDNIDVAWVQGTVSTIASACSLEVVFHAECWRLHVVTTWLAVPFFEWHGWRGNKKVTQKMKDMKRSTQKKETKKRTKLLDSRIIQKSAKALQRNNKKKKKRISRNWISHGKSYQQNDTDPLPPHQRSDVDVAPILVLQSSTKGILGTFFFREPRHIFVGENLFHCLRMVNQLFSSTLQTNRWLKTNLQENIVFVVLQKEVFRAFILVLMVHVQNHKSLTKMMGSTKSKNSLMQLLNVHKFIYINAMDTKKPLFKIPNPPHWGKKKSMDRWKVHASGSTASNEARSLPQWLGVQGLEGSLKKRLQQKISKIIVNLGLRNHIIYNSEKHFLNLWNDEVGTYLDERGKKNLFLWKNSLISRIISAHPKDASQMLEIFLQKGPENKNVLSWAQNKLLKRLFYVSLVSHLQHHDRTMTPWPSPQPSPPPPPPLPDPLPPPPPPPSSSSPLILLLPLWQLAIIFYQTNKPKNVKIMSPQNFNKKNEFLGQKKSTIQKKKHDVWNFWCEIRVNFCPHLIRSDSHRLTALTVSSWLV